MKEVKQEQLTSITIPDIYSLLKPRETYMDILLFDEQSVKDIVKNSKPIARVYFSRLDPNYIYFSDKERRNPILFSHQYSEVMLKEHELFDLSSIGRAMCLAVGRYPHNHLRPFMLNSEENLDPFISREHGLIFLNENLQVCYHDIGTFKKGSTNGTKQNDLSLVKNNIIYWSPKDYFGLGRSMNIIRGYDRVIESKYKLRFEYLK